MYHKYKPNKKEEEDIAVIKLFDPVDMDAYGDRVKIVKLSKSIKSKTLLKLGTKVRVAGFGFTRFGRRLSKKLLSTELSVIDHKLCQDQFEQYYVKENMICMTDTDTDSGTCGGDSGSPSIDMITGQQIGLVSFGPDKICGVKGVPEAHMSVSYYYDWIMETMNKT